MDMGFAPFLFILLWIMPSVLINHAEKNQDSIKHSQLLGVFYSKNDKNMLEYWRNLKSFCQLRLKNI